MRRTCDLNQSELRMYRISHQTPAILNVISSGQINKNETRKFKQDKSVTTLMWSFIPIKGRKNTRLLLKKKKKLTYAELVNEIRDRETLIG